MAWDFELTTLLAYDDNPDYFNNVYGEEYNSIKESISREGLKDPIYITKDLVIIDGYKRAVACYELGMSYIKANIREMTEDDKIYLDNKYTKKKIKRKRVKPTKSQLIALTKRSKCRCEACGEDFSGGLENILQIHHINGDRGRTEEDNLIMLCPNCHVIVEHANTVDKIKNFTLKELWLKIH